MPAQEHPTLKTQSRSDARARPRGAGLERFPWASGIRAGDKLRSQRARFHTWSGRESHTQAVAGHTGKRAGGKRMCASEDVGEDACGECERATSSRKLTSGVQTRDRITHHRVEHLGARVKRAYEVVRVHALPGNLAQTRTNVQLKRIFMLFQHGVRLHVSPEA